MGRLVLRLRWGLPGLGVQAIGRCDGGPWFCCAASSSPSQVTPRARHPPSRAPCAASHCSSVKCLQLLGCGSGIASTRRPIARLLEPEHCSVGVHGGHRQGGRRPLHLVKPIYQLCCSPQLGFSPSEPCTFTTNTKISPGLTTRSLVTLRRLLRSPSLTCHTLHIFAGAVSPNIRPAGEDWLGSTSAARWSATLPLHHPPLSNHRPRRLPAPPMKAGRRVRRCDGSAANSSPAQNWFLRAGHARDSPVIESEQRAGEPRSFPPSLGFDTNTSLQCKVALNELNVKWCPWD